MVYLDGMARVREHDISNPVIFPLTYHHQAMESHQAMEVDSVTASGMDSKSSVRSCTTCSKAKAKCVRQPGYEICER